MRIQTGQLVALGYGAYVRSDDVTAVEPITDGRGPGRRSLVWVRGMPDPLVASRAEGSIVDDLGHTRRRGGADEGATLGVEQDDDCPRQGLPGIRRLLAEESGTDIDDLLTEANRVLG